MDPSQRSKTSPECGGEGACRVMAVCELLRALVVFLAPIVVLLLLELGATQRSVQSDGQYTTRYALAPSSTFNRAPGDRYNALRLVRASMSGRLNSDVGSRVTTLFCTY
ncbi:hypothetical protein BD309DRAFT_79175 [Dichomitus squalens]|uniref:Uncharacterized protein n=1 Tax=Dichomitus squalens TaxID=114155 RepID=A0A4Q9PR07_9APHY|nr:hypothetical protein BD309DRAFT_79175 [Dichomitus squalens]TBU56695.1 hypothetical protein BD310DRAFT_600571 [Dichomitus squalens]